MSFILNVPPSVLAKTARAEKEAMGIDADSDEPKKNKREDYKKLKELEEARKAGTVPAMKDEEGKDINPHIPQYIMQAPWYIGAMEPTLRHQREPQEQKKSYAGMDEWYKRGVKPGSLATKYRKGACENCGAITHQKRDCLERPRRIGARFSGQDIAPDEYLQTNLEHDFEGKRDRWNGYDPNEHKRVIEEFAKLEEAKKQLKAERFDDGAEGEKQDEDKGEDDGDKYAEGMDMPGQEFKGKERITVRNLRIREDTAKYLFNLDVNSAFYDPKTRSMRENPFANKSKDPGELPYAGDNFVRTSGMAQTFASQQMFAWDTYEKGVDVHLQADPTRLELLTAEVDKKKADYKVETKKSILEKYGGQEHLDAPPKQLLLAQTEDYTEYSRYGTIIKGQEKAVVRSRYDEDVHVNNHTSVYGSYWRHGQWGYKCCHSFIKGSYCTGEAGKSQAQDNILALQSLEPKSLLEQHQEKRSKKKRKKRNDKKRKSKKKRKSDTSSSSSSSSSESSSESSESESEEVKEEKVKEAIKKEKLRRKEVDRMMLLDERKRPYNSMYAEAQPTEAEMEAHYRKKHLTDDPMLHFN